VASVLAAQGRFGEMLMHMREAVRLQPAALYFRTSMAAGLFYDGQADLAHRHLRDAVEVRPGGLLRSLLPGPAVCHDRAPRRGASRE
jgi:Flp pilus assembly protein TadD